jgi:hypothetical protein
MGSTFVARRAGIQQASNEITASNCAIPTNVCGSVGLTPKSKFLIVRVNAREAESPKPTPMLAHFIPCPITILRTVARWAPRVMRSPISRVRCATAYESIP